MFRKCLLVCALMSIGSPAWAVGVGTTAGLGLDAWFGGPFDFDFFDGGFAPTLDIHANPVHVQIHVLEFTEALIDDEEIFLGANVLFDAHSGGMGGQVVGVVQPGFGIDIFGDPLTIGLTGQCRVGGQIQDAGGLGIYVVPTVGLALGDGDADWIAGGTLQISAWFGGA